MVNNKHWLTLLRPDDLALRGEGERLRVTAEPLERGFGFTLGTLLKRTMLLHLPGTAVSHVRLPDENDWPEEIPESRDEVLLNIKQISVWLAEGVEQAVLRFKTGRARDYTAGDLETGDGVEVMNPDVFICSAKSGANLRMELLVTGGKGYQPAPAAPQVENYTPVDAVYSPVRHVDFVIENARLGQSLDHDRLVFTIVTDATVSAENALNQAARMVHEQLATYINFEEEPPIVEEASAEPGMDANLLIPVGNLELSVRASNCLANEKIVYVGDLIRYTEPQLLRIPNFGRKTLTELRNLVSEMGFEFGTELPDWPPEDVETLSRKVLEDM